MGISKVKVQGCQQIYSKHAMGSFEKFPKVRFFYPFHPLQGRTSTATSKVGLARVSFRVSDVCVQLHFTFSTLF